MPMLKTLTLVSKKRRNNLFINKSKTESSKKINLKVDQRLVLNNKGNYRMEDTIHNLTLVNLRQSIRAKLSHLILLCCSIVMV